MLRKARSRSLSGGVPDCRTASCKTINSEHHADADLEDLDSQDAESNSVNNDNMN